MSGDVRSVVEGAGACSLVAAAFLVHLTVGLVALGVVLVVAATYGGTR